ncbi:lipopolysaccharide biosynthesis protein [Peribacillus frigoritolerans]|uniref:lipopolysaccharide biosynthesis protein n=1 Tax=Peribacillus frigoritolerans TaxID=450367 RepID=UPI003F875BD8
MLLRHFFAYLLAKGLPGIISFFSILIFTRIVHPNEYGEYALILATVGLMSSLFFQWIRVSLLRFMPKYRNKNERELFSTLLIIFIIISILISVIFYMCYLFNLEIIKTGSYYYLFTLILLLSMAWYELNLEIMRSQLSPINYGKISLVKSIVTLITTVILIKVGFGTLGLIWGLIFGNIIPLLFTMRVWKKYFT